MRISDWSSDVCSSDLSAPVGLYAVSAPHDVERGDMVIARLSPPWRTLADARRYVPANVPLVKRVAAAPGDTVCARGNAVFIDGNLRARRRLSDGQSRLMPWWQGCTTLRDGSRFLLNDKPASNRKHTSELQSLMRISYAVFCLKKKKNNKRPYNNT